MCTKLVLLSLVSCVVLCYCILVFSGVSVSFVSLIGLFVGFVS